MKSTTGVGAELAFELNRLFVIKFRKVEVEGWGERRQEAK